MNKKQLEDAMISRLINTIKGHAQYVLLDKNLSDKQKKLEFDVIDEFVQYLQDYHKNIEKLEEYGEIQNRWIDDGR